MRAGFDIVSIPVRLIPPHPDALSAALPTLECPDRFEARYVSANGGIRWNRRWVNVSTVCIGEYIGLGRRSTMESGAFTSGR